MATDYGYNEDPFMVVKPGGGQDMKGYFHNSSNDTVATADTSRSGSSRSAEDRVSRRGHKSRGGDKHRGKSNSKDGGGGGGGGGGAFGDDFDFDEPAFPDDANFVPDDSHFESSGKDDGGGGRRRRGAPERSASNNSNATAPESADNSAPRRGRRGVQASKSCDGADMEAALGRRGAPAGGGAAGGARGAAGGARPNNPRVRRSGRRASMCGPSSSGASLTGASSSGGGFGGGMYSGGTAAAPVDDKIGNTTHSSPDGVDYGYGDFGGGGGGGGSDGFASFDANFGNDNNADGGGGGGEKKSDEWLNDRSKNQRALLEGFKSGTGYFQDGSKMKGSCRNLMVEPMTAPDPRAGGGGAPAGRRPRRRASLTGLVTPPSNFGKLDDGDEKKNAKGGKGDRKAPSRSASSDGSVMAAMRNERDRRRPGGRRPGGEDGGGSGAGGGGMSYSDRIMAGR